MKFLPFVALALLLPACGDNSSSDNTDPGDEDTVESFGEATAAPEGYTRYQTSVQDLEPGETLNLVEWVAAASDRDVDIMEVRGGQTPGGHHATLTASKVIEDVGTIRPFVNDDQLTGRFLGAAGLEGTGSLELPKNYAFRLRKGEGLYIQTHYVNLTDAPIKVRSYLDVKYAEPSDEHTVLSLFSNNTLSNRIEANSEATLMLECDVQEDLPLLMFTNHMHEWGTSVRTDVVLPDGSTSVIKDDPEWNYEWALNPNYTFAWDEPVIIPKGAKMRTQCSWANTTNEALAFPDEMCVFVAFIPSEASMICTDGRWSVASDEQAAMSPLTRIGDGACSSDEDFSAVAGVRDSCLARPGTDVSGCGLPVFQGDGQCVSDCFVEGDVSAACGDCYGALLVCTAQKCTDACSGGFGSEACVTCQHNECCSAFESCSGLSC